MGKLTVESINNQFENFEKKYKGQRDFLIYQNINDSLAQLNNNASSKYKLLEFYTDEYINEEVKKEAENRRTDEKINIKLNELKAEQDNVKGYEEPIATLKSQMYFHEELSKHPKNSKTAKSVSFLIALLAFAYLYFSFKHYSDHSGEIFNSNQDEPLTDILVELLINPIAAIFVAPLFSGLSVIIIYFIVDNHHKNQYETLFSKLSTLENERENALLKIQQIQNSIQNCSTQKHDLSYSIKYFS